MSETLVLEAQKREVTGKKVKTVRAEGFVPATVYQTGKESANVKVDYQTFKKAFAQVGYAQPVELHIGSDKRLAMIKDVHVDPARNVFVHAAFHAIRADRIVEAEVKIVIEGDVPAESKGNFLVRQHDTILVKGKPADLPEAMIVKADSLIEPGDSVTVADLEPVKNVEIVTEPEAQLAVVTEPTVIEEDEEEEEVVDAADVPADNGGDSEESSDSAE